MLADLMASTFVNDPLRRHDCSKNARQSALRFSSDITRRDRQRRRVGLGVSETRIGASRIGGYGRHPPIFFHYVAVVIPAM